MFVLSFFKQFIAEICYAVRVIWKKKDNDTFKELRNYINCFSVLPDLILFHINKMIIQIESHRPINILWIFIILHCYDLCIKYCDLRYFREYSKILKMHVIRIISKHDGSVIHGVKLEKRLDVKEINTRKLEKLEKNRWKKIRERSSPS